MPQSDLKQRQAPVHKMRGRNDPHNNRHHNSQNSRPVSGSKQQQTLRLLGLIIASALLLSLFLLLLARPVGAAEASGNRQVLPVQSGAKQYWTFKQGIKKDHRLVIKGRITGDSPARVLIRIDPQSAEGYLQRFNSERLQNPGDFEWQLPLDHLQRSDKTVFNAARIRQILLVPLAGSVEWQTVSLMPNPKLPDRLIGWDFGPADQAVAAGFRAVGPSGKGSDLQSADSKQADIQISGPVRVRNRPYHDTLIRDGLEGLQQLDLPLANGIWRLRLWVEDIGEWEYLPHVLQRKIEINGQTVLNENLSREQWLKQRYLKPEAAALSRPESRALTVSPLQQFWQQTGSQRGRPLDAVAEVRDGRLRLKFSSPHPAGRFISGLMAYPLAEPAAAEALPQTNASTKGSTKANAEAIFQAFEQRRYQDFKRHWPLVDNARYAVNLPERLTTEQPSDKPTEKTLFWADNEQITLRFKVSPHWGALQQVQLPLEQVQLYRIDKGLRRAGGQEQALQSEAFLTPLPDKPQAQRQDEEWLLLGTVQWPEQPLWRAQQPPGLAPEVLSAAGQILQPQLQFQKQTLPLNLKALNLKLPEAPLPVGIYLDYAPHLQWFSQADAEQQAQCDYQRLKQLGLTGVAPALPTPLPGQENHFKRQAQAPLLAGLLPPFPAYTPVKRLLTAPIPAEFQQQHPQLATRTPEQQQQFFSQQQLNKLSATFAYLLWSLADEPGLHPEQDQKLQAFNRLLPQQLPGLRRMAQLNHPRHQTDAQVYDAVLVNQGYQLTEARLQQLSGSGKQIYLYNLPWLRFAAGSYLWRSEAQGFWQWHGRMPTAHPFDPTDGREDDVQMLLPGAKVCAPEQLHHGLIGLRQGINDLRWLTWLQQNAKQDFDSAILQQQLQRQIKKDWQQNTLYNNALTQGVQDRIKQLAWAVQNRR